MTYIAALTIGLLAGTHIATWGMYKDAPHEDFRRFKRSVIIAALIAPLIVIVVPRNWLTIGDLVLLFGVAYACERGATEFYKLFIRHEDQSKYFIPMEFHVFGRVVPPGPARTAAAAGYAVVVVAAGIYAWCHQIYTGLGVTGLRFRCPGPPPFAPHRRIHHQRRPAGGLVLSR